MVLENVDFVGMLKELEGTGFYEVALPFLLIFTIIFAVLQKVKIFGPESRKYNVIISVAMALLVVRMTTIVASINMFLPKVSWIVLVFIMALMLLGIFGAKSEGFTGLPFFIAIILSIVGIIWAMSPTVKLPEWLQLTSGDKATLIIFGVAIVAIYFIIKEPKSGDSAVGGRIKQGIEDLHGHFGRSPPGP
ncbi:MAG: hypothetical protein V1914_04440 [archaeon]